MSNIIKLGYFGAKRENEIIDSNDKSDTFLAGLNAGREKLQNVTATDEQAKPKGVTIPPEVEAAIKEQANAILKHAKEEEKNIKAQALKEAKIQKQAILDEAREEGYKEGYNSGLATLEELENKLKLQMEENRREYEAAIAALESDFAKLTVSYVRKITGILVEDKCSIIGYLMSEGIKGAEPSKFYIIHVSLAEFDEAKAREEELRSMVSNKADLEVMSDNSLSRGECKIETDKCIIDCGVGTKLEVLSDNIRLLVGGVEDIG